MGMLEGYVNLINDHLKPSNNTGKKIFGEVMTDFSIVNEMLDLFDQKDFENPNLKWFGPTAGLGNFEIKIVERLMEGLKQWEPDPEKRYKHIVENQIYISEIQSKNMFLFRMIFDPDNKYKLNFFRGDFLSKDFDEHMKNVWKVDKFDRCVENPPFNQMIDMYILQKTHKICDQVCFVHPSTWLLDEKNRQKKFINTKKLVGKDLEQVILFNGNQIFQIALFVPCSITYFIKNRTTKGIKCLDKINNIELVYNDISEINKFSNNDIYPKLKEKILGKTKNNLDKNKIFNISTKRNAKKIEKFKHLNTVGEYYINIAQIRGNVNKNSDKIMIQDDFYTVVTKDNKVERKIDNHMFFKFDFNEKALNFLNYIKTDFARFCLSVNKNNSQLECGEMSFIPWLDFSQEWTDDKLYKHFDLTEDEIKFIEKNIPKYY